ncbi:MAG: serine acetyltransferase [bacterium]
MSLKNVIDELLEVSETSYSNILNRDEIIKLVNEIRDILFLGYNEKILTSVDVYIESKLNSINNKLLNLLNLINKDEKENILITEKFINKIPTIKKQLNGDLKAFLSSDPAVVSEQEIVLCYPGFYAISLYRIANALANFGVSILPRIISEHAHSKTGIDIHPKAIIGENFFIDHGTGVVVGETSVIGNNVKIYQGVTLGAISLQNVEQIKNEKRHPTIEDNVVIYSNTSILGGKTVIGEGSVIGCNVFIVKSIDKNSKIVFNVNK